MAKVTKMIGNLTLNQNERDKIIVHLNTVYNDSKDINVQLGNKICAIYSYKNTKVRIVGTVVRIMRKISNHKIVILTDAGHIVSLPIKVSYISYSVLNANNKRARRAYLTYLIKKVRNR